MKNAAIALLLFATCMTACQNENASEVEQKRQELEAKRLELKEKQELVALSQEMKNVEAEIDRTDGKKQAHAVAKTLASTGSIRGESVILRTGPGAQFDKYDNFANGETVQILARSGSNDQIWYQVTRSNNQTGWVFGKFLEEI